MMHSMEGAGNSNGAFYAYAWSLEQLFPGDQQFRLNLPQAQLTLNRQCARRESCRAITSDKPTFED
jgi:hypothetical protein